MKEKIDSKLIQNYANGHYSFRNLKQIARWFQDSKYHNDIKSVINSYWDQFELKENHAEKDLTSVFNKLKEKILNEKKGINLKQRLISIYAHVAAILLLPLLVYSSYSLIDRVFNLPGSRNRVEIVSPKGTRTHFDLPDGTKVSLNSGAHLKYNVNFKRNRQLSLCGEAYFDVYHDDSSPFIVHTDVMDVTVLGTKFSVASIKEENSVEVVLEEGKVQLKGKGNSFSEVLSPDEKFFYDRENKKGKIEKVDARYLTSWKDGILMFRGEPLGEVMERIGRWYNVKFEIIDPEVKAFRYRATFSDEPLEEVLRLISLTAPVEYKIKERNLKKDGRYDEKTVVVKMKKQL